MPILGIILVAGILAYSFLYAGGAHDASGAFLKLWALFAAIMFAFFGLVMLL